MLREEVVVRKQETKAKAAEAKKKLDEEVSSHREWLGMQCNLYPSSTPF